MNFMFRQVLTDREVITTLTEAGAARVHVQARPNGRWLWLFVFFEHAGVCHVWKVRGDGYVRNFVADVARELAPRRLQ